MSAAQPTRAAAGGFILLHRSLFADTEMLWDIGRPRTDLEAWICLIARAAWRDHTIRTPKGVVSLQRGEVWGSIRFLATLFAWSKDRVTRFISILENDGRIQGRSVGRAGTVYLLTGYDVYQSPAAAEPTKHGRKPERPDGRTTDKEKEVNSKLQPLPPGASRRRAATATVGQSCPDASETPASRTTALAPFLDAYSEIVKGELPVGRSLKSLKALIQKHGETMDACPRTVATWRAFLTAQASYNPTADKCLAVWGQFVDGNTPTHRGRASLAEETKAANDAFWDSVTS